MGLSCPCQIGSIHEPACDSSTIHLIVLPLISQMNSKLPVIVVAALATFVGCDDAVSLSYATRAAAEAEIPFARGWLPPIIPASTREISMTNDLDDNTSNGSFSFDPSDFDAFVAQLSRNPKDDRGTSRAYCYKNSTFWISDDQKSCRFYTHLRPDEKSSIENRSGQSTHSRKSK